MLKKSFKFFVFLYLLYEVKSDEKSEYLYNINSKRPINLVSDKFLSISVDPAVLSAGMNLSEKSLRLAKHLRPSYMRFAGTSTEFIRYMDEESLFPIDTTSLTITPSMWFGINEWLNLSQLMPVFAVNDVDTTRDVWNPKPMLPLFEISDKLNVTCFWQLGFDSRNKTELRYKQDLSLFQHVLTAFPDKKNIWKIVGSDLSSIPGGRSENMIQDLEGIVSAVMWEPATTTEDQFLKDDFVTKFWPKPTSNIGVWTTIPKCHGPITFSSVLKYACQVGDAAKSGYEVVFHQPRMLELVSDTPVYWFTLVFKKVMGRTVLDTRTTSQRPGSLVYAHCTRNQNSYVRGGALTILVVNDNDEDYKVKVKLGAVPAETSLEVQEYILTSSELNSTEIFLNDVFLSMDILSEEEPFKPRIRRAKTTSHVFLAVPAYSVGFFVLPGARMQVCIDNERETDLLLEEIEKDQNAPLPEELEFMLESRSSFGRNRVLEEITQHLRDEMLVDKKYYNSALLKTRKHDIKEESEGPIEGRITDKGRKLILDRARQKKYLDFEKRRDEMKKFLFERTNIKKYHDKLEGDTKTQAEFREGDSSSKTQPSSKRKVPSTSQRSGVFTDEELNQLISEATHKFTTRRRKRDINMQLLKLLDNSDSPFEMKNADKKTAAESKPHTRKPRDLSSRKSQLKSKLDDTRQRILEKKNEILKKAHSKHDTIKAKLKMLKSHNGGQRFRRDINMDLLKVKAENKKTQTIESPRKAVMRLEKEATLRKPGQTSEEILEDMEFLNEEVEEEPPVKQVEVFAELADPDYDGSEETFDSVKNRKVSFFDKPKSGTRKNKKKMKSEDDLQFLTASEEFTDVEDDLPCIHEFYGKLPSSIDKQWEKVVYELGEYSSNEKGKGKGKSKKNDKESMEFADDDFDIEEDLRRKRDTSQPETDYPDFYQDISNIGEFIYPEFSKVSNHQGEDQKVSSVGAFLYPQIFETKNMSGKNPQDYLIEPIKADIYDENEVPLKFTDNHIESTENQETFNPYDTMLTNNHFVENDEKNHPSSFDLQLMHSDQSDYNKDFFDNTKTEMEQDNLDFLKGLNITPTFAAEEQHIEDQTQTLGFAEDSDSVIQNNTDSTETFVKLSDIVLPPRLLHTNNEEENFIKEQLQDINNLKDNKNSHKDVQKNSDVPIEKSDKVGDVVLQSILSNTSSGEDLQMTDNKPAGKNVTDHEKNQKDEKQLSHVSTEKSVNVSDIILQSRLLNTNSEEEQISDNKPTRENVTDHEKKQIEEKQLSRISTEKSVKVTDIISQTRLSNTSTEDEDEQQIPDNKPNEENVTDHEKNQTAETQTCRASTEKSINTSDKILQSRLLDASSEEQHNVTDVNQNGNNSIEHMNNENDQKQSTHESNQKSVKVGDIDLQSKQKQKDPNEKNSDHRKDGEQAISVSTEKPINDNDVALQSRLSNISTEDEHKMKDNNQTENNSVDHEKDLKNEKQATHVSTEKSIKIDDVVLQSRLLHTSDEDEIEKKHPQSTKILHKKAIDDSKKHQADLYHKFDKVLLPHLLHHDFKEDIKAYQQELKDHFKDFRDLLEKDKKKFEEEKKKNKMSLLQMQKKPSDLESVEDIVSHQLQENKNEIMEQFKLLKKRIQMRKNEIDAILLKNLHDSHKEELEQTFNLEKHKLSSLNTLEKTEKSDQSSSRIKRSLLRNHHLKSFGGYQPYSSDLKPWTAADVLSLRREQFLGSNHAPPPNDYKIFKNILDQNRYKHRRRRSIDNFDDNFMNEISNDISDMTNKIVRDSSKNEYLKEKYKKLAELEKYQNQNEMVKEKMDTEDKPVTDSSRKSKRKGKSKKIESNIQKIPVKEEKRMFDEMFENLTDFFTELGKQIGRYLKNFTIN